MPVRNLRDGTIKVQVDDNGSSAAAEVEVTLDEGNLAWTESRPRAFIDDRGTLDHARRVRDEMVEISFTLKFQSFTTHQSPTVYDALTNTGGASAWVSQNWRQSDAWSVRLEFVIADPEGGTDEEINWDYFHPTSFEFSEGEEYSTLAVRGMAPLYGQDFVWLATDGLNPTNGRLLNFTRATTATYHDANGVLQTAASGEPRGNHHPNGMGRTFLLELASTNEYTQSNDFGNAAWTKGSLSVSSDNATGPDGVANSADKLVPAAASAVHYVDDGVTLTGDGEYAQSVYVKADGYNFVGLVMYETGDTTNRVAQLFNLSTGALAQSEETNGTGAFSHAFIEALGSSWYRIALAGSVGNSATGITGRIYVRDAAGTVFSAWTGDGSSGVLAYGAQIEDKPVASSYIATAGATGDRNADELSFIMPDTLAEGPQSVTVHAEMIHLGDRHDDTLSNRIACVGTNAAGDDPRALLFWNGGSGICRGAYDDGTTLRSSDATTQPDIFEHVAAQAEVSATGTVTARSSVGHGAVSSGTESGTNTFPAAWDANEIQVGHVGGATGGRLALKKLIVTRRVQNFADMTKIA